MNRNWGYCAGDKNYKSAAMIVRKLVECVSKGGNMILNVGPDARGNIPAESLNTLRDIGAWIKLNGRGIYSCCGASLPKPEWGRYTQCGNKIFADVYEPPIGPLYLPGIPGERVKGIRLLGDFSEFQLSKAWMTKAYTGMTFVEVDVLAHDCMLPDDIDTVIEVDLT